MTKSEKEIETLAIEYEYRNGGKKFCVCDVPILEYIKRQKQSNDEYKQAKRIEKQNMRAGQSTQDLTKCVTTNNILTNSSNSKINYPSTSSQTSAKSSGLKRSASASRLTPSASKSSDKENLEEMAPKRLINATNKLIVGAGPIDMVARIGFDPTNLDSAVNFEKI